MPSLITVGKKTYRDSGDLASQDDSSLTWMLFQSMGCIWAVPFLTDNGTVRRGAIVQKLGPLFLGLVS